MQCDQYRLSALALSFQDLFNFLQTVFLNQLIADFFDMRNAFQVIAVMPAHFQDAQHIAFPFDGPV